MKNKVFGVGLQRTGTSTLRSGLLKLGLNIGDFNKYGIMDYAYNSGIERLLNFVEEKEFDGAEDAPWFWYYKQLDKEYPNSKFILTTRDSADTWLNSKIYQTLDGLKLGNHKIKGHQKVWNTMVNNLHIYGRAIPQFNKQYYKNLYSKHNNEVKEYFKDRPNDLLVINIDKDGFDWQLIGKFLHLNVPDDFEVKKKSKGKYDERKYKFAKNNPYAVYWRVPLMSTQHGLK